MCEWIWFAGWERLKHLALMRRSAASTRFAQTSILLLALGIGLFQATVYGWRKVSSLPALEPTGSIMPTGRGWFLIAEAPRPLPPGFGPETPVSLWWNPGQAILVIAIAFTSSWLVMSLAMLLIRVGATRAHKPPYRRERRMTAAIHYSTAWCVPVVLTALVLVLRPISFVGHVQLWAWYPPLRGITLSAAVVTGFAVIMWWFWLIRLGTTALTRTRSPVIAFFAIGAPLIVGGVAAGWWWALDRLYDPLFKVLRMNF